MRATGLRATGLLLLAGWLPAQPAQPPATSASDGPAEDHPANWRAFKGLWRSLDAGDTSLVDPQAILAASFGYPPQEWDAVVSWTELEASGVPATRKVLSPARYALAVLCVARIHSLKYEPGPSVLVTRMAYFPPWLMTDQRLRAMEDPAVRIEELRTRWKPELEPGTLLTALQGVRMDVYHYRALRLAADLHRRFHPAAPEPAPSGLTDLEAMADRTSMRSFLRDPRPFQIGTEAWLARYESAVQKLKKELKAPEAARLQREEEVLTQALARLEEARPRLETLFADLETAPASAP